MSKNFLIQLFGLLLIFLLILLAVPQYSKKIPQELSKRVKQNLQENDINWAAVRVEGRDVMISGIAPNMQEHKKAITLSKDIIGVRFVNDQISPRIITPYTMNINYTNQKLTLKGYIPSYEVKKVLFKKLKDSYTKSQIIDKTIIGSGEPKEWMQLLKVLTKELKNFEVGSINIIDKEIHISGKIKKSNQKKSLEKELALFENKDFIINSHIVALDASAQICQEKLNTLFEKQKIYFKPNKAIIEESNNPLFQTISDITALCPKAHIKIIGHTDNVGNDEKNLKLSLKRAKAVASKLLEQGVALKNMEAIGRGELEPLADNKTKDGRAKNRRIEFKVIGY